ncbi:hypothetical protein G8A07_23540 [Roseateles sp. DAIF2]|uniref:hypothetical protein n=1 Tax=Roseateles sp. DAIF2 TaxID=2714952 RepID=UPI0018A24CC9|nr:hypothetical protein [Roseateles sp. DAIF2]QPF76792.1 hypothetical protein G8A07_23540 [Roseateles sp. DAIF2]
MRERAPVVLDLDGSVGPLPGEQRLDLREQQEALRFGCRRSVLARAMAGIEARLPAAPGPLFTGSGDFHHLTAGLIARLAGQGPFDVIVFDNHPDNMRYPWGIHCGSWVRQVAAMPHVGHVQVIGIGSSDVGWRRAWENHWLPLWRGRLSYRCLGADVGWARHVGLGRTIRGYEDEGALLRCLARERAKAGRRPVYLSIDKDVLDPRVARTNWDQGRLSEAGLMTALELLRGRPLVGSDITGDVSIHRYRSRFKRWLSGMDGQPQIDPQQLQAWQAQQHQLNLRLLARLQTLG